MFKMIKQKNMLFRFNKEPDPPKKPESDYCFSIEEHRKRSIPKGFTW